MSESKGHAESQDHCYGYDALKRLTPMFTEELIVPQISYPKLLQEATAKISPMIQVKE